MAVHMEVEPEGGNGSTNRGLSDDSSNGSKQRKGNFFLEEVRTKLLNEVRRKCKSIECRRYPNTNIFASQPLQDLPCVLWRGLVAAKNHCLDFEPEYPAMIFLGNHNPR
jgi:hypothetical protein